MEPMFLCTKARSVMTGATRAPSASASGMDPTCRQSLPNFLVHLIEENADGEALNLIARVTLAQYPPLRCGPSKANRGSSRTSSVHGGSVQGSVRGSVQGSVRGPAPGAARGAHPVSRSARAPQALAPAAPVSTAEILQQMQAQNQALMARMEAMGLGNMNLGKINLGLGPTGRSRPSSSECQAQPISSIYRGAA